MALPPDDRNAHQPRLRPGNYGAGYTVVPLRPDDVIVAELLKQAAYHTGVIGSRRRVRCRRSESEMRKVLMSGSVLPTKVVRSGATRGLAGKINGWSLLPATQARSGGSTFIVSSRTGRSISSIRAATALLAVPPYTALHASNELGGDTGDGYVVPGFERTPITSISGPK